MQATAQGLSRRIEASTSYFAALPHLLRGSTALATRSLRDPAVQCLKTHLMEGGQGLYAPA